MVKMKEFTKVISEKMNVQVDEDYLNNLTEKEIEEIHNVKLPSGTFIVHVECAHCKTINAVDLSLVDDHDMHCADCDRCINNDDFAPESFEYHPKVM